MARNFTRASNHQVDYDTAGQNFLNWPYGTIATVIKRTANSNTQAIFAAENATSSDNGWNLFLESDVPSFAYNGGFMQAGFSVVVADGWSVLGVTKVTGTVAVRAHWFKWSTRTWTHSDMDSTIADLTSFGRPVLIGTDFNLSGSSLSADVAACMALPNRAMTDSEFERLASGRWDRWLMKQDDFLQEFPSGRDPYVSGVATVRSNDRGRTKSTSITGTTRSASADPPGFKFSRLTRRR